MSGTRFLLIEDDPDHAALICAAIIQAGLGCEIEHAASGEAALDILFHRTKRKPDVLLLDINLPGMDGLRVLERIKADHRLDALPVVMLTTSSAEEDIKAAHRSHANSYVVKPTDYCELKRVMQAIAAYWTGVNTPVP
jgi:CheY-like chemotaxis protein